MTIPNGAAEALRLAAFAMRRWLAVVWVLLGGLLIGTALLAAMYVQARADPVVRRTEIDLPSLPREARLSVVLISDVHFGSAAMDALRLRRIVQQVNALLPDMVLIAGDFISGHEPGSAARISAGMVAPLAGLRSRFGTIAVLGNHDRLTGETAVRQQLLRASISVIDNAAVVRGPLAIGGIGDDHTDHADVDATLRAVRASRRPFVLLTHSPDVAFRLPGDARLLLAGHTHCGQIVIPFLGIEPTPSRYGPRYRCGLVREAGRSVIVSAGLGTSILPLRWNAPPDIWSITLRGPAAKRRAP